MKGKFRPSNGTEGDIFEIFYCADCKKNIGCSIMGLAMAFDIEEPEYPEELIYIENNPSCTDFEFKGKAQ